MMKDIIAIAVLIVLLVLLFSFVFRGCGYYGYGGYHYRPWYYWGPRVYVPHDYPSVREDSVRHRRAHRDGGPRAGK